MSSGFIKDYSDEELLELIISYMFTPAKKSKGLEFLKNVLDTSELLDIDALSLIYGNHSQRTTTFLKAIRRSMESIEKNKLYHRLGTDNIKAYLVEKMGSFNVENYCLIFLDSNYSVVQVKKYSNKSETHSNIILNNIIMDSDLCNSQNVIIAHNHPSGSSIPSDMDYKTTESLVFLLKLSGINLLAHYLLTPNECVTIYENSKGFL